MDVNNIALRRRFVSDYNFPIQIMDSPYFEYFIDLYEPTYQTKTKWDGLQEMITRDFKGDVEMWLSYYSTVRDTIIRVIEEKQSFKDFSSCDMGKYLVKEQYPDTNIYISDNIGKVFLSIDLKKANFQALKLYNPDIVYNRESYSDFIGEFSDSQYIKDSKYTRQVIFGKLNPKRTMQVEHYMVHNILSTLNDSAVITTINDIGGKLIAVRNDEIVFSFDNYNDSVKETLCKLCYAIQNNMDYFKYLGCNPDLHVKPFVLGGLTLYTKNGKNITSFKCTSLIDESFDLKCTPVIYMAQFYKRHFQIQEPCFNDNDRAFYHEGQIAYFRDLLTTINE